MHDNISPREKATRETSWNFASFFSLLVRPSRETEKLFFSRSTAREKWMKIIPGGRVGGSWIPPGRFQLNN
jgi:hypothetical protein